jgi:hypothetical protein
VPPNPTEGLHEPVEPETFGPSEWHGQETVPQHGGPSEWHGQEMVPQGAETVPQGAVTVLQGEELKETMPQRELLDLAFVAGVFLSPYLVGESPASRDDSRPLARRISSETEPQPVPAP